jgi:predicted acyl esterase
MGCSAGAFDFFEPLQNLDGYDVIETIARQPWVLGHKVGMMGISYGGISQLFTAQLDPPSLEAISPLSVIDATATTLYPGGDLNDGFAVAWAKARQYEARPASPNGGQPWAYKQIQNGDQTCKQNQVLHEEATDLMAKIHANSHYKPSIADPLDPDTFVHKITVPTFMACQWEDEQTGGHCANLVQHFTGTSRKWFTFTNGAHIDSLDPYTYDRWYDFLQLFVAHKPPIENLAPTEVAAPVIYQAAMGINNNPVTLPPDPIQAIPTYSAALAAFERLPPVRVLFDNGAGAWPPGPQYPGDPYPTFEHSFSSLPVPGTSAGYWFLEPNGALGARAPRREGINWYESNPSALPANDYPPNGNTSTGGLWGDAPEWQWDWRQNPSGTAVSYLSPPLHQNTTVIGAGQVRVWVRSAARDVDLQATVTEVRPDGKETFVQDGWMRASERKLSTGTNNMFKQRSTVLAPVPSFTVAASKPMPKGRFVEVTIPLYYEGHVYRAGSRIRVIIAAPNGTQPIWSFAHTKPSRGQTKVWIAFSRTMPSALILPIVPGVSVPTGLPPCPSLRNEPCRAYAPFTNRVAAASAHRTRSRRGASRRRRSGPAFTG